jgi:tRNA modification GTPase
MMMDETICALSTPAGNGAIAVIRVSGKGAIEQVEQVIRLKNQHKKLSKQKGYTIHFGKFMDGNEVIDEVLVSLFRPPHSYTGQEMVEISCHGSIFIQQRVLEVLQSLDMRLALPGEFTQRAFLNGKLDLAQAEAVSDLISSGSEAAHKVALHHMKGGVSKEIKDARDQLLEFTSLLELELDFSEEDVEFADRSKLKKLSGDIISMLSGLKDTFHLGNALKSGIPVTIIGQPNVGKSTLLNALLNEERAIVSEIAGTTRDALEDTLNINGYLFRFIDTAGLRTTRHSIESMGIRKTMEKIGQSSIVLFLFDINESLLQIKTQIERLQEKLQDKKVLVVINKMDLLDSRFADDRYQAISTINPYPMIRISAKKSLNIDGLCSKLVEISGLQQANKHDVILTNARHHGALTKVVEAMDRVNKGLDDGLPSDLIAMDTRQAIHYLGEITGEITTDEVLGNIFKNFCIGK